MGEKLLGIEIMIQNSPQNNPNPLETHIHTTLKNLGILDICDLAGSSLRDGNLHIALQVLPENLAKLPALQKKAQEQLSDYPGISAVSISFTRKSSNAPHDASKEQHLHQQVPNFENEPASGGGCGSGGCGSCGSSGGGCGSSAPKKAPEPTEIPQLSGIKCAITVGSGKGGVGKSTTAINLACALSKSGLKVGILDADIYGPSLSKMLGTKVKVPVVEGKPYPVEALGLKTMSLSYMIDDKQAVIWRGPMVMGALTQFLQEIEWGELDVLVVDMPPGTGDAHLTITQKLSELLKKGGSVLVSTPQDVALLDTRRSAELYNQVNIPLLGLIENMSIFHCAHCGKETDIFGQDGAKKEAESLGIPFLGAIPLSKNIRIKSDDGQPIVLSEPESPEAAAYVKIAEGLAEHIRAVK
ncbi:gtp-binding protein [Lasius niger]|uniref:Gtp-binding protein n=1 Tax=Lasius niger TaxID=67767 RepID=A0A0J7KAR0_LASNI|nr:gtp-binding protein [Lasius niger]